jgi:hypothetical protein
MTHFGERVYIWVSHTDSSCWKRQSLVLVLVPFPLVIVRVRSILVSFRNRDFVTVPVSSPHNLILVPQDSDDVRREKADMSIILGI